jgi:hypothetical protein
LLSPLHLLTYLLPPLLEHKRDPRKGPWDEKGQE